MLEAFPITYVRQSFLPLMERVNSQQYKFMVTKQGKPVAVVLSYEEYSRMVDTLLLLHNTELNTELKQGLKEIEQSKLVNMTELNDEQASS